VVGGRAAGATGASLAATGFDGAAAGAGAAAGLAGVILATGTPWPAGRGGPGAPLLPAGVAWARVVEEGRITKKGRGRGVASSFLFLCVWGR